MSKTAAVDSKMEKLKILNESLQNELDEVLEYETKLEEQLQKLTVENHRLIMEET